MTETGAIGPVVAFIGGLLSFLSPCVLPLVPSYLGFVTGFTLEEMGNRRRLAMIHAVLFVLGFSLIFILLGASATALGSALKYYKDVIMRVGGLLIIFFGLYSLGVVRLGFLNQERRMHLEEKPLGYLGSVLVGMAFGAGWSPCIGPILGGILGLAATEADLGRGVLLLMAYSAGLAVPFLVAAAAVERFLDWFQRFRRHIHLVQKASGILLIAVGLLIATGQFTRLAGYLQKLTPDFLFNLL
ncbi:MAG: cytochrome c biogenesis CcdA family protein [Gemmatimonadales bacterium]